MTNGRTLIIAGLTAAAIAGGAACAPPVVHSPGLASPVLPQWSRMDLPPIFLSGDAAERGRPWCGAYVKVAYGTTGDAFPCDAGMYSESDAIGTFRITRTRVDVDLSSLARGKDLDDSLLSSLAVECDDDGGELITHVDGRNVVAAVDCEDVDY